MSSLPKNQGESNEKTPPPEPVAHTPGPWAWLYAVEDQQRRIGIEQDNPPYGDVMYITGDSLHFWFKISDADARLIATAPELLAALRNAQEWLSGDVSLSDAKGAKLVIDAAIAKAEGSAES